MGQLDVLLGIAQLGTGLIKAGQGFAQGQKLRENPPTVRPGTATTADEFPASGINRPTGNLAIELRNKANVRLAGPLRFEDVETIQNRLQASGDADLLDQFNRYVASSQGGTPTAPDLTQLIQAAETDLVEQKAVTGRNFERESGAITAFGRALSQSVRGAKNALATRTPSILAASLAQIKQGAADVRLAQATAFLPAITMNRLRNESLAKFTDQSVAEQDMISGALKSRHDQESNDLRGRLSAQGMAPEFIESQILALKGNQANQVNDALTDVKVKHQALQQNLDLATQGFVGTALGTTAAQTTKIADISRSFRAASAATLANTQMELLRVDQSIRMLELGGQQDIANWTRGLKEVFIPSAGLVEDAFALNIALDDRERNAELQAFGVEQGAFTSIENSLAAFQDARNQREAISAQSKAGSGGVTSSAIGAGGTVLGAAIGTLGGPAGVIAGSAVGAGVGVGAQAATA